MKRIEVLQLNEMLSTYSKQIKDLQGPKFAYAIIKNSKILKKEVEDIQEANVLTDEFKAHEKERIELCEKFAKKDEKGEIIKIAENNSYAYDIDMKSPEWIAAIDALKEKNKEAIEIQEKKNDEFDKFLDEESEVKFFKISIDEVPENISVELMSVIDVFIKE